MKLFINTYKKTILTSLFITALVFVSLLVHDAYAAKATISLNSPVSFPVDI